MEFRVEKTGIVHTTVGKVSFAHEKLKENLLALMDVIVRAKPVFQQGNLPEEHRHLHDHGAGDQTGPQRFAGSSFENRNTDEISVGSIFEFRLRS